MNGGLMGTDKKSRRKNAFPHIYVDGFVFWRNKEGEPHRIDGPAVEHPGGTCEWWQNGVLHCASGPAIKYADGRTSWYKRGVWIKCLND